MDSDGEAGMDLGMDGTREVQLRCLIAGTGDQGQRHERELAESTAQVQL